MKNRKRSQKINLINCKKYLYRTAGILAGLVIFTQMTNLINFLHVGTSSMTRVLWHNFYEDKGKIDNLYLGTSHVFCDIDPAQLDEINGQYNFNLATAYQRLNCSYYLLKEAAKNNSLSHVYLDMYYTCIAVKDLGNDPVDTQLETHWRNTDYMEPSLNKIEYMFSIAGPEKYTDIILPFSRYRSKLGDWDYINDNINNKNGDDYLEYKYYTKNSEGIVYKYYTRQGYYSSSVILNSEDMCRINSDNLDENPISEKSKKYLYKIIDYCKKYDIPLTFITTPINELQLIDLGNYDNFINQVKEIAAEYGIDYYDFNLAKDEYLPIDNVIHYRDPSHLNDTGAAIFTEFLAKVVSGTMSENEQYFYSSYAEKLKSQPPKVYGLIYENSDSAKTLWIASNKEDGVEYRVVMTPQEGETYIVQDFAENKEFTVPKDEKGLCSIEARAVNNPDEIRTIEIEY